MDKDGDQMHYNELKEVVRLMSRAITLQEKAIETVVNESRIRKIGIPDFSTEQLDLNNGEMFILRRWLNL